MKQKKEIKKIAEFDFDWFYEKKILSKTKALVYWFNKKMNDGSDVLFVVNMIQQKVESLNERLFNGYDANFDGEDVYVGPDSFLQKLYVAFERKEKLAHKHFISDTIKNIELIRQTIGRMRQIDQKGCLKVVNDYAYYRAYLLFIGKLKHILENRKPDNRIKGKLTKVEIEQYFKNAFAKKQKDQNPLLSEEQIKDFLCSNFIDFTPYKEITKYNTPIKTQKLLRKIIYQFHLKHNSTNLTSQYVNLLLNNFSAFNNTNFEVEKKNFSK